MKLSEALMERRDTKTRMEGLKKRLYAVAKTEEGIAPPELPVALLTALYEEIATFESLVTRIDTTNATVRLPDGSRLVHALIRRDMLRYRHLVASGLADHAVSAASQGRYSARELRTVPAIDVAELRRAADSFAREGRLLDSLVQRANWATDLEH